MTIDELRTEMQSGFKKVDERFNEIDGRFNKIDERSSQVDDNFKSIDKQFKKIDDEFAKIRAEMKAEGETTRRHFDIVGESIRDSVQIVAEGNAHHTSRLDNHETRIKRLEKRSGP